MKKFTISAVLTAALITGFSQNKVPPQDVQIKTALLAAPAEKKDSAAVYGYSNSNELILLRKGTNEIICLGDDPQQRGFSVACYHKSLEPFMQSGRALRKQGKSFDEIFEARENQAKAGTLPMPKQPTTLFVYTASAENYDAATGEVKDGYLRYVVYIPYATAESTGLPLQPSGPAMPWLMNAGTHSAHIMINPPPPAKK